MPTPASPSHPPIPTLRIARPTTSLPQTLHFYSAALGLALIASFDKHVGFSGRILAPPAPDPTVPAPWHLEFTYQDPPTEGGTPESVRAPTADNLLVLYLPDEAEYDRRTARMQAHGYAPVESANPYWEGCGTTFQDAEGWRVVLVKGGWGE